MGELIRVNDIVIFCTHYDNGDSHNVYARIDRIVLDGREYKQLMVITGYGDDNTRCLIDVTYLFNTETLKPFIGNGYSIDPHKLHKPKFSREIERCMEEIELNKKKLEFFEKYENPSRERVIDDVLEEIEK